MVVTILEAHVREEQWGVLRETYEAAGQMLPPQMLLTLLLQDATNPTLWRGVSVWESREALEEYWRSVEPAGGALIFRPAGAEPTLSLLDLVAAHRLLRYGSSSPTMSATRRSGWLGSAALG